MDKKLYKENGLLSEYGQVVTSDVKIAIYKLLNQQEDVKKMSENELRTFGGALQKIVGDLISERVQFKNEVERKLSEMKDAQFEEYLKEKYGSRWMLVSLTDEEFARLPRLSKEDMQKALEEGIKARNEAIDATPAPYLNPGLRFK
jgi:hypothetical protein